MRKILNKSCVYMNVYQVKMIGKICQMDYNNQLVLWSITGRKS